MTVKRPDDGEREGVWVAALGGETHHPGEWPLAAMELASGELIVHKPDGEDQWLQSDVWIDAEDAE